MGLTKNSKRSIFKIHQVFFIDLKNVCAGSVLDLLIKCLTTPGVALCCFVLDIFHIIEYLSILEEGSLLCFKLNALFGVFSLPHNDTLSGYRMTNIVHADTS